MITDTEIQEEIAQVAQEYIKEQGPSTSDEVREALEEDGSLVVKLNGESHPMLHHVMDSTMKESPLFAQDDSNRWHMTHNTPGSGKGGQKIYKHEW